jgi:iron complex transport system permease protein
VNAPLTRPRLTAALGLLATVLLAAIAIGLATGSEPLPLRGCLSALVGDDSALSPEQHLILFEIRMPRVLLAALVGAALAVAGAAFQALLRNPLAEPYVLGVSGGAALGAVLALMFAAAVPFSRTLAAFVGALIAIGVVFGLGQGRDGGSTDRLILAGVIANSFLSSAIIFVVSLASEGILRGVYSWLIGDLSGPPATLLPVAVVIALGVLVVWACARSLNLLMAGERDAAALGVETERVKGAVFVAASLATGAAVSVSGMIGFVGLIVPHAVRLTVGSDNRVVVPASALVGAAFLLLADAVARTVVAPRELHIGVVTALIGAPVFVALLRRSW